MFYRNNTIFDISTSTESGIGIDNTHSYDVCRKMKNANTDN